MALDSVGGPERSSRSATASVARRTSLVGAKAASRSLVAHRPSKHNAIAAPPTKNNSARVPRESSSATSSSVFEADPERRLDGLSRIALSGLLRSQRPAELSLPAVCLRHHLGRSPCILDLDQEIADDCSCPFNHQQA